MTPTFPMLVASALVPFATQALHAQIEGIPTRINEIHYDNAGTDTGEFIEVKGPAGTDLTNWSLWLYNGSTGTSYDIVSLSGSLPDQCHGVGTAAFYRAGIQNGSPDGIALVDGNTSTVVEFLSYEGRFRAADGPAISLTSRDIGASESSGTPIGWSLQRFANGWGAGPETPGACNCGRVGALSFGTSNFHSIYGAAQLVTTGPPILGTTAELQFIFASPDNDPAAILLSPFRMTPPIPLGSAEIHIEPSAHAPVGFVNNMGATIQIPIALDPALCTGVPIVIQAFMLDITNPGTAEGFIASTAVEWVVGDVY